VLVDPVIVAAVVEVIVILEAASAADAEER
jgi:hypothetical protein